MPKTEPFDPDRTIVARVRRRIVPNWRSRLRDYSTIALGLTAAISTALLGAWSLMPPEWKAAMPKDVPLYLGGVYMALGIWGGVGKFITQPRQEDRQP